MSENLVIARIRKSSVSEVWVVVTDYTGKLACDVREYFHPADSPEWLPKQKGVAIPRDLVGEAVNAAEELASRNTVGEVAALVRGEKAKIVFGIREFQKHIYGEIRTYYVSKVGSDDWKPGKGVTLPLSMLGQLVDALRLAEEHMGT